jgi:hypothetical protein
MSAIITNKTFASRWRDRMLLFGAALLVCVVEGAAFWYADVYHVNPAWVFFGLNSLAMIPLFIRNFRGQLKRASFLAFLAGWAIAHGLLVLALMLWVPLLYWIPILGVEMFAGYIAARLLFGVVASAKI